MGGSVLDFKGQFTGSLYQGIIFPAILNSRRIDCQSAINRISVAENDVCVKILCAQSQFIGADTLVSRNGNGVIRHISQPGKIVDQESCIGAASGKSEINDGSGTNRDPGPGVDAEFPFVSTAAGDSKPST